MLAGDQQEGRYRQVRSSSTNVRQWEMSTTAKAHAHAICALSMLGNCVVTGSSDATIAIWRHERDTTVGRHSPIFACLKCIDNVSKRS